MPPIPPCREADRSRPYPSDGFSGSAVISFVQVTARRHHRAGRELSAFRHVSKCSSLRLINRGDVGSC